MFMKFSKQTRKNTTSKNKTQHALKIYKKHIMNNIYVKIEQKTQKVKEKFGESSGKFGE